jgi:hypothetical protein
MNRQDACSTKSEFSRFTGILPVLENGAKCEFLQINITIVSRLLLRCCTILNKLFINRQDACSTKSEFSRFTGILPVLEHGARCEFLQINIT